MKWFRHYADDCLNSESLDALIETLGFEGYGRWWRILEIVASKMDASDRCHAEFSIKKWCEFLRYSDKKLRVFCAKLEQTMNKTCEDSERITFTFNEKFARFEIPNLRKYRDEYTSRIGSLSGQTREFIGSLSGQTRPQRQRQKEIQSQREINSSKVGGGRKEQPSPNGHHPEAHRNPATQTRTEAVIEILHRIGQRTGIREYQEISALSWIPDLRKRGLEIGYDCLHRQALRFEQHMLAKHESGELAKAKSHHPRAKFMNVWLSKVYDNEKTTGDRDEFPATEEPRDFDL